ncbi:MAG TPA: YdcF family protein [Candidatus Acidoferrum sp.]|nr:YdcF family protein [Candidatus Acidoferrum sp.]
MTPIQRIEDVKSSGRPASGHPRLAGWESAFRALGLAGVVLFLAFAFTPLPNRMSRRLEVPSRLEPADAIVVLGASVSEDGVLADDSLRRAIQGILLERKGFAPLLVLSGPAPKSGRAEAEVRADLARDLGVSSNAILTDAEGRTTREEAIRIGALLRPRQVRRVLLVTDPQHMLRARRLFEQAGFEVLAAPADDDSRTAHKPEGRLNLTREVLQEVLARLYYRVAGYL